MENPDHCIVFSFADFSFWCYACDDYVVSDKLDHGKAFFEQKFGEASQKEVFKIMKDSKHQDQIQEEEEDEDEEETNPTPAAASDTKDDQ